MRRRQRTGVERRIRRAGCDELLRTAAGVSALLRGLALRIRLLASLMRIDRSGLADCPDQNITVAAASCSGDFSDQTIMNAPDVESSTPVQLTLSQTSPRSTQSWQAAWLRRTIPLMMALQFGSSRRPAPDVTPSACARIDTLGRPVRREAALSAGAPARRLRTEGRMDRPEDGRRCAYGDCGVVSTWRCVLLRLACNASSGNL